MSVADVGLPSGMRWRPRIGLRRGISRVFFVACLLAVVTGLAALGALVIDVALDGAARLFASPSTNGLPADWLAIGVPSLILAPLLAARHAPYPRSATWARPIARLGRLSLIWPGIFIACWVTYLFLDNTFLGSFPSRFPERAGIYAALIGTLYMMAITAAVAFPLGVGAAIYLEEYARQNWLARFIQLNIANLAGVPSIVYGLLGLQVFVRVMDLQRSVLAGALTMALLVMPVIVVSAQESLRAVPPSMREAAYALGATRWQVIRHHVLPYAFGGMLTGNILAMSRAIGETAPLIMIGALTFIAFLPQSPTDQFTVLPIQIFNWVSRPQEGFHVIAAATIIVLMLILLVMNSVAIIMRQKTRTRW